MHHRPRNSPKLYFVIALCGVALILIGSVYWYATHQASTIALPTNKGPVALPSSKGATPPGARVRLGKGGIDRSAVSPDGNYLAVGNAVGVYLYDATTFEQVLAIPCGDVFLLDFGPDSQTLLSVASREPYSYSRPYTVSLWDVKSGHLVRTLEIVSESGEFDVAWVDQHLPLLAVERHQQISQWSIRLVDVSTAQDWPIFTEQGPIAGFALSPDGTKLAYNVNSQLIVWSIPQKKTVAKIPVPPYGKSILFSPDGTMLFVGAAGTIDMYQTETGNNLGQYTYTGDGISLGISRDGSLLAGVSAKTITVWNVPDRVQVKTLTAETKLVDIAWDSTSATLFTRSDDNRVYAWSLSTTQLLRVLEGHSTDNIVDLAWSADSRTVATLDWNYDRGESVLFFWDVDGNLLKKIVYRDETEQVTRSLDDEGIVAWSPDNERKVAWSPDNERIVFSISRQLVFLDRSSFAEVKRVQLDGVEDFSWSPDSKKLAVALDDRKVIVLDVATGASLLTISVLPDWDVSPEFRTNPFIRVSWSPDGSRIAAGMFDGPVYIWEADSGKQLAAFDHPQTSFKYKNSVIDVKWSADSRYLAGGFVAGGGLNPFVPNPAITIWDTLTGRVYRTLNGYYGEVWSIDWSPNSDFLAVSLLEDSDSSSIYLWDTNDEPSLASDLHSIMTGAVEPYEVRWSPNGEMLAARFDDSTVVIWDAKAFKPPTAR